MSVCAELFLIEGRLGAADISVARLCREAGIARSTWDRWRSERTEPNVRTWRAVTVAVDRLTTVNNAAPLSREDAA